MSNHHSITDRWTDRWTDWRPGRRTVVVFAVALLTATYAFGAGGSLLIKGGLVYTVTGPTLKDGDVLVVNGTIEKVGHNLTLPKGGKLIKASGKVVVPGFVVAKEVYAFTRGWGTPPDGIDIYGTDMKLALASGVTAAYARGHVVKMTPGDIAGLVVGEVPVFRLSSTSWRGRYELRRNLIKAREYLRQLSLAKQAQKEGKAVKPPSMSGVSQNYVGLLTGEMPARVSLSRAQDILRAVSLAREFNVRLIIEGGVESWAVAEEVGRANAAVVMSVRTLTAPPEDADSSPGSNVRAAAILRRAGVPFALIPPVTDVSVTGGIIGRDITSLAMEAAFAVRGGLDEATALAAITIEPAKILGVAHRIGSLEEGKDADILVLDGDPLFWKSFVELAIVNGTVYYDRAKSDLLPK